LGKPEKHDIEKELRAWLRGAERVVVVGIGNPIRMDDFVGVKIVRDLRGKASDKVLLIEAETVPENHIQQIIGFKPSHILLIDAAILELKPGESRLINPNQLTDFPAFSTHMLPLRIFCEYVAETTEAKIALLLIEPKETDFGEGLTQKVTRSVTNIVSALLEVLAYSSP